MSHPTPAHHQSTDHDNGQHGMPQHHNLQRHTHGHLLNPVIEPPTPAVHTGAHHPNYHRRSNTATQGNHSHLQGRALTRSPRHRQTIGGPHQQLHNNPVSETTDYATPLMTSYCDDGPAPQRTVPPTTIHRRVHNVSRHTSHLYTQSSPINPMDHTNQRTEK